MTVERTALQEWKGHWPLVCSAMAGMSFYSVITYSLGTFIQPLEEEFGWGRGEISFGLTIFALISTLGGPFIGAAVDRFGTRIIAIAGLSLSSAAFAAFGLANGSLAQWYGLFAVYGLFALGFKSTIWSAGISSAFSRSRSLALAVMLMGSAIGQAFAPAGANWLIKEHGWRTAYAWMGAGWGGFALLMVLLFFVDAREKARRSSPAPTAAPPNLPGMTVREALHDRRIIRIAIGNLILAIMGSGVSVHLVPIVSGIGLDKDTAVAIAFFAGAGGIVGKLLVGVLLDHVQGSAVPFLSYAVAAIGYALLLGYVPDHAALAAGAFALGFSSGAGLQVSTYLVSRYAGLRNFGTIFGTISSMMMAGTAIGPVLAGGVYDFTGSYFGLLVTAIPVALVAALLFAGLGAYPDWTRPDKAAA